MRRTVHIGKWRWISIGVNVPLERCKPAHSDESSHKSREGERKERARLELLLEFGFLLNKFFSRFSKSELSLCDRIWSPRIDLSTDDNRSGRSPVRPADETGDCHRSAAAPFSSTADRFARVPAGWTGDFDERKCVRRSHNARCCLSLREIKPPHTALERSNFSLHNRQWTGGDVSKSGVRIAIGNCKFPKKIPKNRF